MKVRKMSILVIIYLVVIQVALVSCNKEDSKNNIYLEKGSYIDTSSDKNIIYSYNGNKVKEIDKVITNYNIESNSYLYYLNGYYYVYYKGKSIRLKANKIYHPIFSPDGEYLLYLCKEKYILPKIYSLEKNKEIEMKNDAVISGEYIDWFSNGKLAYYGVNDNKEAGIYTYDIISGNEKLIYKINDGFVKYFKYVGNGIAFVKQYINGNTTLKIINVDGNVIDVTEEIKEIYDIIAVENVIYFLGKIKDNTYSLYSVKDNIVKKVVFDFPSNINIEKGLSYDKEGNILFIGSNNNSEENVYKYNRNNEISILSNISGNYNFININ